MRRLTSTATALAVAALAVLEAAAAPRRQAAPGAPVRSADGKRCITTAKRPAWHTLSDAEKRAYTAAEVCVMKAPARTDLPGAVTRFDELVSNHQIQALQVHSTGAFLPYHRYLLHVHEAFLRDCNYTGPIPWWDESRDAGQLELSDLFDDETGIGGDGSGYDRCITDGPFVDYMTRAGPGFEISDRCISRTLSNYGSMLSAQNEIDGCNTFETYDQFWVCLYMYPHLGGMLGLGSMLGDSVVSSGDPGFYLHHAFIDKLWWDWQMADEGVRLYDISGPNEQDPDIGFYEYPGDMEEEAEYIWGYPDDVMLALAPSGQEGDPGNDTTLNHVLGSVGLMDDIAIGDVMDIRGDYLCYEYV